MRHWAVEAYICAHITVRLRPWPSWVCPPLLSELWCRHAALRSPFQSDGITVPFLHTRDLSKDGSHPATLSVSLRPTSRGHYVTSCILWGATVVTPRVAVDSDHRPNFDFIFNASVTIEIVSRRFTETQSLTPDKQWWLGKVPVYRTKTLSRTRLTWETLLHGKRGREEEENG